MEKKSSAVLSKVKEKQPKSASGVKRPSRKTSRQIQPTFCHLLRVKLRNADNTIREDDGLRGFSLSARQISRKVPSLRLVPTTLISTLHDLRQLRKKQILTQRVETNQNKNAQIAEPLTIQHVNPI